MTMEKKTEGY